MTRIKETEKFNNKKSKLDKGYRNRLEKLIRKILENLEIGKPMRYERKGTREIYLPPFRVSYSYDLVTDTLTFLEIYHKKRQ